MPARGTGTGVARLTPPAERFIDSHCLNTAEFDASNGRMTTSIIRTVPCSAWIWALMPFVAPKLPRVSSNATSVTALYCAR